MNRKLKKASTYLITMLIITAVLFGLNYYYGGRLVDQAGKDIRELAAQNNYQLRNLEISANPLFQEINIEQMTLFRDEQQNIQFRSAVVKLSWQQIIYLIRNNQLSLKKDLTAEVESLNYSDLINDYRLRLTDAEISYSGSYNTEAKRPLEEFLKFDQSF